MYENIIRYHPLTGNYIMEIVSGESFLYEEEGVEAVLTPTDSVFIHTPAPQVYCRH